jgi:hypothetical protein
MTLSSWNPFGPLRTPDQAKWIARLVTAPAAYAVWHGATLLVGAWPYVVEPAMALTARLIVIAPPAVSIAVPAMLAWRVWGRQARWAAIVLLLWFGLGLVATIATVLTMHWTVKPLALGILVGSAAVAALSLRACFWLARQDGVPDTATVADEFA